MEYFNYNFDVDLEDSNIEQEILAYSGDQEASDLLYSSSQEDSKDIIFKAHTKQDLFIEAALSGKYRYLCYGGAIRGGKTFVGLGLLLLLCKIYPGSRWLVTRETHDQIVRNVLPAFNKIVPKSFYSINESSNKQAKFINGSEIIFIPESATDDPDHDKFKGLEINGALLEEADGLRESFFYKMVERSGTWIMKNMPPKLIILTCNPSQGWVKKLFYTPYSKGTLREPYFYMPAFITDNPYIPKHIIDSYQDLPEALRRRFVEGSWEATDHDLQLFAWEHLNKAKERLITPVSNGPWSLGADIAWQGKDRTVITLMEGFILRETIILTKTDPTIVSKYIKDLILKHRIAPDRVWIDIVGIGAGVQSNLIHEGFDVQGISGGSSAVEETSYSNQPMQYYNFNAQIGWQCSKYFEKDLICGAISDELLTELASNRYYYTSEKYMRLFSKQEIKTLLGKSPDLADSFKYALWGQIYDQITPTPGIC